MLDGSISDTQLASGVGTSANNLVKLDANAKLPAVDGSQLTNVSAGKVLQVKNVQDGTMDTGTTTIPFDNTIPQITEGDEYMTLAFTPTSTTSKLKIDVVANIANDASSHLITALFVGTTANALACAAVIATANFEMNTKFTHFMEAGATTELIFRVRVGASGAGTTTFNGQNEVAKFGGVSASSITITEIAS